MISYRETETDDLLKVRIMRVITSMGFAEETGIRKYCSTPLTKAMTKPALESAMRLWYVGAYTEAKHRPCKANPRSHNYSATIQMKLHDYLRETSYRCPSDGTNCAFQWTFDTSLSYFDHVFRDPQMLHDFNTFMTGNRGTRRHWTDWFPVKDEVLAGSTSQAQTLLVDVGGGKGHDAEHFVRRFPQAAGHVVLQDLPKVLDKIHDLHAGVQVMSHDFFTPQPVQGKYFIEISPRR